MANELPLPPRVDEIDQQIQTLELLQQGLDALTVVRNSLGETVEVLDSMKGDLKGETLSFKDLIKLSTDKTTGEPTVELDTTKIDPLKLDKTQLPANLVKEAIRAQKVLEELIAPFAESQSTLLKSLSKISAGLDKGSDLFGKVADGIKNLQKAWDVFDRAMEGEISADELIEAFDTYFSGMLEVFANTIGKVPGLGPLLEQYAKAIKSIIPDLKKISAATMQKNEVIRNVFNGAAPAAATKPDPKTFVGQQSESIRASINELKAERTTLLDAHQAEAARLAVLEVNQFLESAEAAAEATSGWTFARISEIVFSQMNAVFIGWPSRIQALAAKDPNDPQIAVLEAKIKEWVPELRDSWRTQAEMLAARLEELERLIRANPELLQEADLRELQNRFPQLEPVITEIRVGNARGGATKTAAKKSAPRKSGSRGVAKKSATKRASPKAAVAISSGTPESGNSRRVMYIAFLLVLLVVIGILGLLMLGGGDEETAPELVAVPDAVEVDTSVPVDEPETNIAVEVPTAEVVEVPTATVAPVVTVVPISELVGGEYVAPFTALRAAGFTDEALLRIRQRLVIDLLLDFFWSRSDTTPGNGGGDVDIVATHAWNAVFDAVYREFVFDNTVFGCGEAGDGFFTVCDANFATTGFGEEEMVIAMAVFDEPIATADWNYVYSAVFDADGDTSNNFEASPDFDWDQYQATDRWWVIDVVAGQYTLGRFDGTFATPIPTAARAVVADNSILWFIPRSELGANPTWRATSFRHDGSYAPELSAGDATGTNPTEAPLPVDPDPIVLNGETVVEAADNAATNNDVGE